MKKRGFTLIELLAVIVVLGIIAALVTPMVKDSIESSRKGVAESSAANYIRAVEIAISNARLNKNVMADGVYFTNADGNLCILADTNCSNPYKVSINGNVPENGSIVVIEDEEVVPKSTTDSSKITALNIDNKYTVSYNLEGNLVATVNGKPLPPTPSTPSTPSTPTTEKKEVEYPLDSNAISLAGYYTDWAGVYGEYPAKHSDYISLTDVKKVKYSVSLNNLGYEVAFFNANKEFMKDQSIVGRSSTQTNTVDVPAGAAFVMFSHYGSATATASLIKETEVRVFSTFSILGDSYSTFTGYLTPSSNGSYYPQDGNDVTSVDQTWWKLFEKEYGSKLEINNSYTGGPVSYHGWSGNINVDKPKSFVTRVKDLKESELIIVEGGTNDLGAGAAMGEYKYSDWTESDLNNFRPALAYVLDYIQKKYPSSTILFMANSDLSEEMYGSIDTICAHYGVNVFKMKGITKVAGHPNVNGMKLINDQLKVVVNRMGL